MNPIIYGFLNRSYRKVIVRKVKFIQHKIGEWVMTPRNMIQTLNESTSSTPKLAHCEVTTELVEIQECVIINEVITNESSLMSHRKRLESHHQIAIHGAPHFESS